MVHRPAWNRARHNARQFLQINAFTYAYKAAVSARHRAKAGTAYGHKLRFAKRKYRCGTTPKDDDDHDDYDDDDNDGNDDYDYDYDYDDSRVHTCVHRNVVGNRRPFSRHGLGLMALAGLLWPARYHTRHVNSRSIPEWARTICGVRNACPLMSTRFIRYSHRRL